MMSHPRVGSSIPGLLAVLLAVALLAGCARHDRAIPELTLTEEAAPKRYERHMERDLFRHWSKTVYFEGSRAPDHDEASDQATILEQWGPPDYTRRPFTDFLGDRIHEWLYVDELTLFQFHDQNLVYEGPITDFERIMLERGYPSKADIVRTDERITEVHFFYRQGIWPVYDVLSVYDGDLIYSSERN